MSKVNQLYARLLGRCGRFLRRGDSGARFRHDGAHAGLSAEPPLYRRYLSDQPRRTEEFLQAAKDYVGTLEEDRRAYLYEKPFDRLSGHADGATDLHGSFYNELYQVLNLLQAMEVPFGGRILEVGSGPGWVTEIFLGLGYAVDAVEPCEDLIRVAQERIAGFVRHHRRKDPPRVAFHCTTLEDCELPGEQFDGVYFHAALHHVIDEEKGLAQCFRLLRPGGILGVCETAWQPGNRGLEESLEEEMARSGTLEDPFTAEYLNYLLHKHGFVDVVRYHGVNGLFPRDWGERPLREVAQFPAAGSNTLTARKPGPDHFTGPTTASLEARTLAEITVLGVRVEEAARKAYLRLKLANRGETAWLHRPGYTGCVRIALYQGDPDRPGHREAEPRQRLPRTVRPGEELVLDSAFYLPSDYRERPWQLDLLSERLFWFEKRGSSPAVMRFP